MPYYENLIADEVVLIIFP